MNRTVIGSLKTLSLKVLTVVMAMVVQFDIMDSLLSDVSVYAVDESVAEQTIIVSDDMHQSSVIDEAYCSNSPSPSKSRIKNLYNHNLCQYIQDVYTFFFQQTQRENIVLPSISHDLWILYCVYII